MNPIAPKFSYNATDTLNFVEANATRKLLDLGRSATWPWRRAPDSPEEPQQPGRRGPVLAGTDRRHLLVLRHRQPDRHGRIRGSRREPVPPARTERRPARRLLRHLRQLADAEVRLQVASDRRCSRLRGTYSEGFRAPTAAETGNSSTLFGLGIAFPDPILCGNDKGMAATARCRRLAPTRRRVRSANQPAQAGDLEVRDGGLRRRADQGVELDVRLLPHRHQGPDHHSRAGNYSSNQMARSPTASAARPCRSDRRRPTAATITGTRLWPARSLLCNSGYVNANATTTSGFDFQTQYKFNSFDSTDHDVAVVHPHPRLSS